MTDLTTAAREMHDLQKALAAHEEATKLEAERLRAEIRSRAKTLAMAGDGLDEAKIEMAKTVVYVRGQYDKAGDDRTSVINDVIRQLSTGDPIRPHYGDIWHVAFGTKNYDGWRGQRCDSEYGYGPKHGSICFQIGLTEDLRKMGSAALTPERVEAAIYYVVNIARVQAAEAKAKAAA